MNKRITGYIKERRNNDGIILVNDDSTIVKRAHKLGQEHELDMLEIENEYEDFHEPRSWKLFVISSVLLNIILMGFFILRSS